MALIHQAFLLDKFEFEKKIRPIVQALSNGEAGPLYEEALKISLTNESENWVLSEAGSSLFDIRYQNFVGVHINNTETRSLGKIFDEPSELGYWFLLILSEHLQKCTGIGIDYAILERCLRILNMDDKWIKLLFQATPVSKLVNPNVKKTPSILKSSDKYWHWVRPSHAKRSGWLTMKQIDRLYSKLLSVRKSIHDFDPQLFGNKWELMPISIPEGQVEYKRRVIEAYNNAIEMLSEAKAKQKELFVVVNYT